MIIHPASHFFEALPPQLEPHEEEIIYPHPTWPGVSCNQLGIVYIDDEIYTSLHYFNSPFFRSIKAPHFNLGAKPVVVYECYHGTRIKGKMIYHINGNVYDYRKENLLVCGDLKNPLTKVAKENKSSFILKSVQHLVKLENKFIKEGISNQELHETLMLPPWLIAARKKYKDGALVFKKEKS